jgi:hypothetical protein
MTERTKALSVLGTFVAIVIAAFWIATEYPAAPPAPRDEMMVGPWGEVQIKYVAPPLVVDKDTVLGVFYSGERLILIDRSMMPIMRRGVRAHELCHAALSDDGVILPDSTEENVCSAMEKWEMARR